VTKIYYNIKLTLKKTKAKFGRLLQPPAWKQNGSILENGRRFPVPVTLHWIGRSR